MSRRALFSTAVHVDTTSSDNVSDLEMDITTTTTQDDEQEDAVNMYDVEYGSNCEKLYTDSDLLTTRVRFDYEMVLSTQVSPPQGVSTLEYWTPALEWGLLWSVADELGVHGCQFKDDPKIQQQISPQVVVSLSSYRADKVDGNVASCQFLNDADTPSSDCYAMVGSMKARYYGNMMDEAAVQSYLLSIVQSTMNQNLALTGAVEQTLFLGQRQDYQASQEENESSKSNDDSNTTTTTTNSASTTTILAYTLTVTAVLVLMVFGLVGWSRRKRQQQAGTSQRRQGKTTSTTGVADNTNELEHAETGSSGHSSLAPEDAQYYYDDDGGGVFALPPDEATTATAGSNGETTAVSQNSGDSNAALGENMEASTADEKTLLPPKPPQGPSKAPPALPTLMKPRRKKKKKKKQAGLIPHVNSRDNVKAMETIAESEGNYEDDGHDDDDDDSDSDYSYETDESGPPSRDPSPIRADARFIV